MRVTKLTHIYLTVGDCLGIGIFVARIASMTRKTTALLIGAFILFAASPASAYCIVNRTADTLYATLTDYHPLADFNKTIKPGKQICCDWFDRRCNPTGSRGALISIRIIGHKNRAQWKKNASKKIKNRRKGRTVQSVIKGLSIPDSFDSLYCVDGIERSVRASAGGTVTITKSGTNAGKLHCASRDAMLRPVNALTRQRRSVIPLITAPRSSPRPGAKIPLLRDELMK